MRQVQNVQNVLGIMVDVDDMSDREVMQFY